MIIYMVMNKINNKKYIGQTILCLEKRKKRHIWGSINNTKNIYFWNALKKYGEENFEWKILHECNDIENLNRLEIYYIKLYNTFELGYNCTSGGRGGNGSLGMKHTKATKLKWSKMRKGKTTGKDNPMYGRENKWGKHSKEAIKKISESRIGKNNPNYGKFGINNPLYGKNHPRARPVIIEGKYFDTIREAARFIKVDPATIRNRIKKQCVEYVYANN